MLLTAALALSNCCLLSSGCNGPVAMTAAPAPVTSAAPAAPGWDGLSETPAASADDQIDVTTPKPTRRKASKEATSSQLSARARADLSWEQQQALDRDEEARLSQKLIICKNCSASQ
jgi:hypothetical protein